MPPLRRFPAVSPAPGILRRVIAESPALMVVAVTFEAGALGPRHSHPHAQATYVESGRFRFDLGAEVLEVGPGDGFVIPPLVEHGCLCLEAGRLIDTFTPRRDDFL